MNNNIIPYYAIKQAANPKSALPVAEKLFDWSKLLKRLGLFGGTAVGGATAWNMWGPESLQKWIKAHAPRVSFGAGGGGSDESASQIDPLLLGSGGALLGGLGAYSMTKQNDKDRAIKALLGAGGGGLLGYLLANYLKQNAGS